jgi:hypothetical protein
MLEGSSLACSAEMALPKEAIRRTLRWYALRCHTAARTVGVISSGYLCEA